MRSFGRSYAKLLVLLGFVGTLTGQVIAQTSSPALKVTPQGEVRIEGFGPGVPGLSIQNPGGGASLLPNSDGRIILASDSTDGGPGGVVFRDHGTSGTRDILQLLPGPGYYRINISGLDTSGNTADGGLSMTTLSGARTILPDKRGSFMFTSDRPDGNAIVNVGYQPAGQARTWLFYLNADPQNMMRVNGSIWADGTYYTSSARWKDDILPIGGAMEKVKQLRGVTFRWRTEAPAELNRMLDANEPQVGLVAEEVAEILPEAVATSEDGESMGVDYAKLVPLLIEGMKEQQQQIDALQKEVQRLTS